MPLPYLFSRRRALERKKDEPFVYELPLPTRVGIIHIWRRALPESDPTWNFDPWDVIENELIEAHRVFWLVNFRPGDSRRMLVERYFHESSLETEKALDVVELVFRFIDGPVRRALLRLPGFPRESAPSDEAIADLNKLLRQDGIGFQFEGRDIVRVDSQFLHAETVKPALALLTAQGFDNVKHEFMTAHSHYRKGEYEETLSWAGKAFESAMKTICDRRKWPYDKNKDTVKMLIEIVLEKGLLPGYAESGFTSLRTLLESGLPTVRNRNAGHGAGSQKRDVPVHIAAFGLHTAATNILLLVEAHKALP